MLLAALEQLEFQATNQYSDKVVELHGWPLITFCVCLLSWQPTYKTVEDGVFVHMMHFELFFHN